MLQTFLTFDPPRRQKPHQHRAWAPKGDLARYNNLKNFWKNPQFWFLHSFITLAKHCTFWPRAPWPAIETLDWLQSAGWVAGCRLPSPSSARWQLIFCVFCFVFIFFFGSFFLGEGGFFSPPPPRQQGGNLYNLNSSDGDDYLQWACIWCWLSLNLLLNTTFATYWLH